MQTNKVADTVRRIILIVIGAAIAGYALEAVLIPNSVIDGGGNRC